MSGASIGELFKILGKNEKFSNYCKEIENGKSINEIIEMAMNDIELMTILNNIIEDNEVIKNKMEVIIGQKKKVYEKNKIIENKENKEEKMEKIEKNTEKDIEYKYKPFNFNNIVYSNEDFYMEKCDNNIMRLVTIDYEIYY